MFWTTEKVRETFLNYFRGLDHVIVPSIPLVNKEDPTLMFVNAGMNAFKDIFLGVKKPVHTRVANTQRCLRVSGKHNDLEEVGHDTYHHTFFEMLGNWSFGDYFKQEAIQWAWQLLTDVYNIPEEILWVTVFNGEGVEGVPFDEESYAIWKEIVPENRILSFSSKENFWEMGDVGPCGPSTEIHIDLRSASERKQISADKLINQGDPRVIELWNLVFIQYERFSDGSLKPLSIHHVDTGMGLERLAMVMQGKQSTYEIDLFDPLRTALYEFIGRMPQTSKDQVAERVILDHIRAITFAIADGQIPSNIGAGYVIRRILRRAIRYAYQFFQIKEPFLYLLVPVVMKIYENVFPEVQPQKDFVARVVKEEEENFLSRIEKGVKLFEEQIQSLAGTVIPGNIVFELYDTYGFPVDLISLMARERGLSLDLAGFEQLLEEQRNRSRQATQLLTGDWVLVQPEKAHSRFIGYDTFEAKVHILRYRQVTKGKKTFYQLVLDKTPFYPEGGGQIGDTGFLIQGDLRIPVIDTKRENENIVHYVEWIPENPKGEWIAQVDQKRRKAIMRHHTATHLLHAALRQILGAHVEQRGSFVGPQYLRFDFSHYEKVSSQQLRLVEQKINEVIQRELPVIIHHNIPLEEAKKMGAIALFGEKYGEKVRVVQIGDRFSIELCGGTHVNNTKEIIYFKIVSESAIGAGIRRIEARAGYPAISFLEEKREILESIQDLMGNPPDPISKLNKILNELKETKNINKKYETIVKKTISEKILSIKEKPLVFLHYEGLPVNLFREIGQELKKRKALPPLLCFVIQNHDQIQTLLFTGNEKWNAKEILMSILTQVGGKGGGNPSFGIGTFPISHFNQFRSILSEKATSLGEEIDKGVI